MPETTPASPTGNAPALSSTSQPDGQNGAQGTVKQSQQQQTTNSDEGKLFTQAELNQIVQQRLKEEQKRAQKKAEQDQLPELDRLKRQLEEFQSEARRQRAENIVLKTLSGQGAEYPEAVWKIVKDDLVFDDAGNPTNVELLLKTAKQNFPKLFGKQTQPGSPGKIDPGTKAPAAPALSMNDMIRAALR